MRTLHPQTELHMAGSWNWQCENLGYHVNNHKQPATYQLFGWKCFKSSKNLKRPKWRCNIPKKSVFLKFSIFDIICFFRGSSNGLKFPMFEILPSSKSPSSFGLRRQGMHCAQLWWWYHHANVHAFVGDDLKSLESALKFWTDLEIWVFPKIGVPPNHPF